MNENKDIKKLKSDYDNIEIPNRLDEVVEDALNSNKRYKKQSKYKWYTVAASIGLTIGIVNINPTLANALERIPIIGNVVEVINFKNYTIHENGIDVSIDIPKIQGLEDKELEYKMNEEFEAEGKALYDKYVAEMNVLKEQRIETKESFESWYEVKTDNEDNLSLIIYNYYAQGSSNTSRKIYNIDKKNNTVLTLEGIFKDDSYVDVISNNIKEQMRDRMEKNVREFYWIDQEEGFFEFEKIDKEQDFYINDNNEIVICFDKYDVAPGSHGLVEFVIPTEVTEKLMK